jgi:hypothetical protein
MTMSLEPLREGRFICSPVVLVRKAAPEVVRQLDANGGAAAAPSDCDLTETDLMVGVGG